MEVGGWWLEVRSGKLAVSEGRACPLLTADASRSLLSFFRVHPCFSVVFSLYPRLSACIRGFTPPRAQHAAPLPGRARHAAPLPGRATSRSPLPGSLLPADCYFSSVSIRVFPWFFHFIRGYLRASAVSFLGAARCAPTGPGAARCAPTVAGDRPGRPYPVLPAVCCLLTALLHSRPSAASSPGRGAPTGPGGWPPRPRG